MKKDTIKIVSLNLWRFNDWQKRLPAITTLIGELNPDVVLLQEVQTDPSFDKNNQIFVRLVSKPHGKVHH
jgi:endonuclease/exonuclease/phosphatase family metal-dependent hydrolase